jgi:hypothetical protein
MEPNQADLSRRMDAFVFDEHGASLTFSTRHAKLQKGVDSTRSSDPQAVPLAVGLFGLRVLPLSGLAELELALRAPPSDGGGGGCGGGGGGGCGGCGG